MSQKDHSGFDVWSRLEEGGGGARRPFRKVLQETMMPCLKEGAVEKENTLHICEVLQVEK